MFKVVEVFAHLRQVDGHRQWLKDVYVRHILFDIAAATNRRFLLNPDLIAAPHRAGMDAALVLDPIVHVHYIPPMTWR
jgi:hypothetical protein